MFFNKNKKLKLSVKIFYRFITCLVKKHFNHVSSMGIKNHKQLTMAGFTLIEMVVALMILSSSVILLSRMKSGNKKRIDKSYHYHKAVLLLERKTTQLELEWSGQNFNSIPLEQKGQFKGEKDFSWSVKTQPLSLPAAKNMLKVLDADSDIVLYVARTTAEFLSSAIKEVKVSVHYNKLKKKSSYSVSTYIVDYNKKIPFTQLLSQLKNQ